MLSMLLMLIVAHALCDFPLQGDFLAKAKNHQDSIKGVPWGWAMAAHCAIHAGAVAVVTGSWLLGAAEFVMHWVLDYGKNAGYLTFGQDQAGHLLLKVAWVSVIAVWGEP